MSIAKLNQSLRSVARYGGQLAEEDQLDAKPTNLESHLCCCQKHTGEFGKIVDVHSSTLPLVIAQAFFHGHNLDHLQSRQYRAPAWGEKPRKTAESGSRLTLGA
jgi:hypothetical protein